MKELLFLVIGFPFFPLHTIRENELVNGHYISNDKKEFPCRIIIPKDFGQFNEGSLFKKVIFLDSLSRKKKYTANDIGGYSFSYQGKKYNYLSRQVEDNGTRLFVWPLNTGNKINEYYYYTTNSSGLDKGSMNAMAEVYVLENAETLETVSIVRGGTLTDSYKAQMRRFFENDKKLLTLLARDVKDFHDISFFVKDANHPN